MQLAVLQSREETNGVMGIYGSEEIGDVGNEKGTVIAPHQAHPSLPKKASLLETAHPAPREAVVPQPREHPPPLQLHVLKRRPRAPTPRPRVPRGPVQALAPRASVPAERDGP